LFTNLIENLFSPVPEIGREVRRGQSGTMVRRWTAAGMLEAERGFRNIAGYRPMPTLLAALHAHDAQLDRAQGQLDMTQNAVYLTMQTLLNSNNEAVFSHRRELGHRLGRRDMRHYRKFDLCDRSH
jgi:hypothetical protein